MGVDDVKPGGSPGRELLTSTDGVTSPVSFTRGTGDTVEVVMLMSPGGFGLIWDLAEQADVGLEDVIGRALVLYRDVVKADRAGKAVGVVSDPGVLDVRFVDL